MQMTDDRKYVILYKQPRLGVIQSPGGKRDIIWQEKQEELFADDDSEALKAMRAFMELQALQVGNTRHQRSLTKLVKFFPYRVISDFIPGANQHAAKLSAS